MNIVNLNKLHLLTDSLLVVLDKEKQRITNAIQHLNQIRACVIKRQDQQLEVLLEHINDQRKYTIEIEHVRQSIRTEIADVLGCNVEDVTLSKMISVLETKRAALLTNRQKELKELVNKLKFEHSSTQLLLRECARINTAMLRSIFGSGQGITYDRQGTRSWDADKAMVNLKM